VPCIVGGPPHDLPPKEEDVMPVIKCSNGKWRIGKGKCIYKTKKAAERAYRAYLAKSHADTKSDRSGASGEEAGS